MFENDQPTLLMADDGVGADAIQVTNLDRIRNYTLLYLGNLLGERAFGEEIASARAGMGKHPGAHNFHAVGNMILAAQHILSYLGYRVGTGWVERCVFCNRDQTFLHLAVNFR